MRMVKQINLSKCNICNSYYGFWLVKDGVCKNCGDKKNEQDEKSKVPDKLSDKQS